MPTYALPPNTRAAGTGNPPADMNSVVDVLNHGAYQRVFYLDQYGADPTGAVASDTAWTNCYADASAAVQARSGVVIQLGGGTYKFSPGVVAVTDGRIGFRGAGRHSTSINTTGTGGSLVKINALSGGDGNSSAPVGGFTAYGWAAGAAVNGIEYGDRPNGCLTDVTATGFGAAGSRGFWFHDSTGLSEGSYIQANADQNTVNYDFDAGGGGGSFDYSVMFLHLVATTAGGNSATGLRMVNNMHCNGGFIHLSGNASATTGLTTTVVQVGVNASDTCHIQGTTFIIGVECDTSAGTVKDFLIQGASGNAGIVRCNGNMFFQNSSGTYTIGTVTSPAILTVAGHLLGPTFAGHGSFTIGANAATFSVYSG